MDIGPGDRLLRTFRGNLFIANLAKFLHGGWVTMLLAGIICMVMYVWYNAEKIRNSYVERRDIRNYFDIISDIKADESIGKFATSVVYMSKALR